MSLIAVLREFQASVKVWHRHWGQKPFLLHSSLAFKFAIMFLLEDHT
jgi:hypothetical protein